MFVRFNLKSCLRIHLKILPEFIKNRFTITIEGTEGSKTSFGRHWPLKEILWQLFTVNLLWDHIYTATWLKNLKNLKT